MNNIVIDRLRELVAAAGSMQEAARRMGISPSMLSLILDGKRRPGKRVLAYLGIRRQEIYVKI